MVFPFPRLKQLPIAFFLTAAVLGLSLALPLPRHGLIAGVPSVCPFFNLTGLPCPGCGLTRSFVSVGHGHVREAFAWHPLGPLLFAGALVYLVGTARSWKWPSEKIIIPVFGIALLAFWVLRLTGVFPMPSG